MTARRIAFLFASMLACAGNALAGPPGIAGNWARNDGTVRIHIAPCGTDLCAVNTWVRNPNSSEHVGDKLILTLRPAANSTLTGQAYDVRRQLHLRMTITLQGAGMRTSGCALFGILCKSADWTRLN